MLKKSMALFLVTALVLGLLAGCGSSAGSTASASEEPSAAAEAGSAAPSVQEAESGAETEEEAPPVSSESGAEASEAEDSAGEAATSDEETEERVLGYDAIEFTPVDLPVSDEPVTYTIWYGEPFTQYVEDPMTDVAIFSVIEELTNVSFEFSIFTMDNASERFQLLYAADDLPDIIQDAMSYYTSTIDDAVFEDEFLYNYADDLDRMPNYASTLNAYPEAQKTITSGESGAMVSFPEIYKDMGDISGYMIRKDYLDATGMDVPETYDELHDVMLAIHNETGSCMEFSASGGDSVLGGGFGINVGLSDTDLGGFYVEDGEVKMGILEPEFVDYLNMVKQWYEEGIIYQDFVSFDTGDLGGFFAGIYSLTIRPPEIYNASMNVLGVETVGVPNPVMNKGETIHVCGNQASCLMDATCWSINSNVAEEDVEIIEKLVDWMYSEEGSFTINWGEEGVTYTMGEDGTPKYTDLIANNPDGRTYAEAAYLFASGNRTRLPFLSDYARCFSDFNDVQWDMVDLYSNQCDHEKDYPLGAMMTNEQKETYNTVAADIATYISENVLQFIYGQKDMSEWDSFVDTIRSMGVDTAIEMKQAAYDDYLAS